MLILVVVVISILAIVGTTFLQVVRVQRQVTAEPIDNFDLVLAAVIADISSQLHDDVWAADGSLFGTNVEPYDYPKTDTAALWQGTGNWPTISGAGTASDPVNLNTQVGLLGGQNDDHWLASTVPDVVGSAITWPKISRLTPRYFYPGAGTDPEDLGATASPGSLWFNAIGYEQNVAEAPTSATGLVDADADGFGDSRWERASIPLMTGTAYFMAVRIIDASSLVNLMANTAINADGTDTTIGPQVTGYFPTSADMARLARKRTGNGPSTHFNTFFGASGLRAGRPGTGYETPFVLSDLTTYPAAASYGAGQIEAWLDGAAQPGQLTQYAEPLMELHWRGGLDDASRTSTYESEIGNASGDLLGMPAAPAYDPSDSVSPINDAEAHFHGTTPGTQTGNMFPSTRHMLTPVSGYALYSPNHEGMHGTGFELIEDLVYEDTDLGSGSNPQTRVDRIQTRLESLFSLGAGYPNATDQALAAGEFALAIQEYSDPDGTPSAAYNDGTNNYYGLEALPFIREAYFQMAYGGAATNVAWLPVPNGHGYVVEIANPFDRPITTDASNSSTGPNIRVALINATTGAVIAGSQEILPDATVIPAVDPTNAAPNRHVLALVSDGSSPITEDAATGVLATDVINLPAAPTGGYTVLALANNLMNAAPADGTTQIGVALQVEIPKGSGTWVTYDRLFDSGMTFPTTIDFASVGATPPVLKTAGYLQKTIKRDETGRNYLSNLGKTKVLREPADPANPLGTTWPDDGYQQIDALADVANGVTGEDLTNFQIPMANRPMFSVAELGWIHMFGFSDDAAGDFPQRFSGTGPAAGGLPARERFLRFDGAADATNQLAIDIDGDATADLTYAEAVLGEFSTLSPAHDTVDNNNSDGDANPATDADEAGEQFVFGAMNINTAPDHLAILSAAYPDTVSNTEALLNAILTDRDTAAGFASIGQLVKSALGSGTAPSYTTGDAFDLYPMFENSVSGSGTAEHYTLTGDAEEKMKQVQLLLQTYSVRSDIFIAFIYIKGYPSADFTGGVVESGRAIVVFDRGQMTSPDDSPEVLGVYVY